MPRNNVTDLITDQEIAFAHLVLSGTMNDREAAEAAGLNPTTVAYTKSKARVRDYMVRHRNAVAGKLVDQEAEGFRSLNLGRVQILERLWKLANLAPEETKGSIAGQIKAMSMIIAIEGLVPDRRRQNEAADFGEVVTAPQEQFAASQVRDPAPLPKPNPNPPFPETNRSVPGLNNPFTHSPAMSGVSQAVGAYDVHIGPATRPIATATNVSARAR